MLRATGTNVLVKTIDDTITSSTLVIPDIAAKKQTAFIGEVIDVGIEYSYEIEMGDKIIFNAGEGTPVKIGDEEFLVLKEERVLGVIKDDD